MSAKLKAALWTLGTAGTLALATFIGSAIISHAQDESKEKRLSDVEQVAVQLGKIHEAEDAKRQQTIDHCNGGIITHCGTCRAVGIDIKQCHK